MCCFPRFLNAWITNPLTRRADILTDEAAAYATLLGFQRAGFMPVAAYDNWDPAVETYRVNFGNHIHAQSINAEIDALPATVIVGGPPCQGFSSAGMRRPDDARNTLVGEFSRLIA